MKFSGYWVLTDAGKVVLKRATFDETELNPATNWKQAWQNQEEEGLAKGYVDLDAALISAATSLARSDGRTLSSEEINQVTRFYPAWRGDRCEIQSLSQLFHSNTPLIGGILGKNKVKKPISIVNMKTVMTKTNRGKP